MRLPGPKNSKNWQNLHRVAKLGLGGGTGYLTRKYGLTIDNLIAADVVLADGSFVTVDESHHEDLFWALHYAAGEVILAS
jgi:hypothetical protein